jgi:hypothetical protein
MTDFTEVNWILVWERVVMRLFVQIIATVVASSFTFVQVSANGYIATFARDGTLLRWFDAGMIGDQMITSVDVDCAGNFWVGRTDRAHGNYPSPNDKVVKYDPSGTELLAVKGPLAEPRAAAVDSAGNIYVVGGFEVALGNINRTAVFKYDPSGVFIESFALSQRSQPDRWHDLLFTSDDRLFLSGELSGTIAEFTSEGTQVRLIDIGVRKFVWGLALDSTGENLWSLDLWNGVGGEDTINRYDLNLNFLSGFDTGVVDGPWIRLLHDSIEIDSNGNLLVGTRIRGNIGIQGSIEIPVVHELSVDGTIRNTIELKSIANIIQPEVNQVDVRAFTIDNHGDFVFGFNTRQNVPEPASVMLWAGMGLAIHGGRLLKLRVGRR